MQDPRREVDPELVSFGRDGAHQIPGAALIAEGQQEEQGRECRDPHDQLADVTGLDGAADDDADHHGGDHGLAQLVTADQERSHGEQPGISGDGSPQDRVARTRFLARRRRIRGRGYDVESAPGEAAAIRSRRLFGRMSVQFSST